MEIWTYCPETRRLLDANGLKVAENVLVEDARIILSMQAGLHLIVGGDVLSWQAKDALDGKLAGDDLPAPAASDTQTIGAILDDMLAYQADQFDGPEDEDLSVSGADLVDAFTAWRGQLRAALAVSRQLTTGR